jgi:hypothetical protein
MKSIPLLLFLVVASKTNWLWADDIPTLETRLGTVETLIKTHCLDCHNNSNSSGGLNLAEFDTQVAANSQKNWDTTQWEKIVRRLRSRQMPPPTADRPDEAEYTKAIEAFESILDRKSEKFPRPGRTESVRRLNRTEYRNAIRDLLALDLDLDAMLPTDQLSHGFDNVTVGELSPSLLNRYITAAEKISRKAVGRLTRSPGGITLRVPADRSQESHVPGLPLGTRGGAILEHQFPASGEYEVQLRLMRDRDENIEGLNGSHDIDVLLDRALVHRFTVSPPKGKQGYNKDDTLVDANLKKRFHVTAGLHKIGVTFPRKFSSLSEIRRQPFDANFNRHRHPRRAPALFEMSVVGPFAVERKKDRLQPPLFRKQESTLDTPSRRQLFVSRPSNEGEAISSSKDNLRRLMRLAYRRPITDIDLAVPLRFFQRRFSVETSAAGEFTQDAFDAGIESAVAAVLVNPHFLFRAEKDPTTAKSGQVYQISDIELASRLSFFIWSSIPDEPLLHLAEAKKLSKPDVLKSQVKRMLKDDRSQALVTNFAAQWLYLRNLESFKPDRRLFPDFDDNLRKAMKRATELLFEDVLRNDRSVLRLIHTRTTFLNERLAKHYGVPHVFGSKFRPVELSAKSHRGGLLRHASILAVTSYATRTSPTIRGNWILENILGTPAPPPPPNVPSLKENRTSSSVTIRQRLAEHRANPACASCHNLMDLVGTFRCRGTLASF